MSYRVTGYVSKCVDQDGKRQHPAVGKITLQCSDYDVASHFARNISVPDECHVNVDFEMGLFISRRRIWVDANIHDLERAAETLMEAAQSIRNRKPRQALAKHGNGGVHPDDCSAE